MSTGTAANPVKVVLNTNAIISGIGFGGKPRKIIDLALDKKIQAVTSSVLLAELEDVIFKKFPKLSLDFESIREKIQKNFVLVKPKIDIDVVKDDDDNRVLEAAVEGECRFIVTGDRELLKLASYKDIKIVSPNGFIEILTNPKT